MMKVTINNKEKIIPEGLTVAELLKHLEMKSKTSVWVNGYQLLLKEYEQFKINENDIIKILKIIGGG